MPKVRGDTRRVFRFVCCESEDVFGYQVLEPKCSCKRYRNTGHGQKAKNFHEGVASGRVHAVVRIRLISSVILTTAQAALFATNAIPASWRSAHARMTAYAEEGSSESHT